MNKIHEIAYAMTKKEIKGCSRMTCCRFLEVVVGWLDSIEVFMKTILSVLKFWLAILFI